jgi:hypothetical protein
LDSCDEHRVIAGQNRSTDLRSLGRTGAFVANLSRFTIPETQKLAAGLESMGYRSLSYGESLGREAFTQAAILLQATTTIAIATGIASIYGRDPWAMTNAARTLSEAYPGRFVLGIAEATVTRRQSPQCVPISTPCQKHRGRCHHRRSHQSSWQHCGREC